MLTFVIQAGGESRRMGINKALLRFVDRPLIVRVVDRIKPYTGNILITANESQDFLFLGLPVVGDVLAGTGALGGLYTALTVTETPYVAVVACDMPFVNVEMLLYQHWLMMESGCDAVIPHSGEGLEPLHAVYRRDTCLPAVEAALARGERRMISWLPGVQVRTLGMEEIRRFDPDGLAFLNVNTPEEFGQAERLAQSEKGRK